MPKLNQKGIASVFVILIVLAVVAGGVIFQQYTLHQAFSQQPISCGGDWNYNVKCPLGSSCNVQDPLVGGWCTLYLSFLFGNSQPQPTPFESTQPSPSPINNTPDWKSVIEADAKQIQVALELYFSDNKVYPQNLEMLKPKYFQTVPKNRYTMESYPYESTGEQYTLRLHFPDGTVVTKTSLYK